MPSNRQEILNLPSLRQLPLSDPDLGGQIDLFLGNMDLDDCTGDHACLCLLSVGDEREIGSGCFSFCHNSLRQTAIDYKLHT